MFSKPFKRLLLIGVTTLTLVLAIAPASFAGEDDDDDSSDATVTTQIKHPAAPKQSSGSDTSSSSSSGSSDTQVAVGGVQTGAGGTALSGGTDVMLPLSIGGALILLSSAGAGVAFRRR
jgi:hypothetical protein